MAAKRRSAWTLVTWEVDSLVPNAGVPGHWNPLQCAMVGPGCAPRPRGAGRRLTQQGRAASSSIEMASWLRPTQVLRRRSACSDRRAHRITEGERKGRSASGRRVGHHLLHGQPQGWWGVKRWRCVGLCAPTQARAAYGGYCRWSRRGACRPYPASSGGRPMTRGNAVAWSYRIERSSRSLGRRGRGRLWISLWPTGAGSRPACG